jgi:hypothetical protein
MKSLITAILSLLIPITTFAEVQQESDFKAKFIEGAEKVLNEAIHTEEVERDLEDAATQYERILQAYLAHDWLADSVFHAPHAATALYRLGELRRKQGRKEEARKHYEEVVERFAGWEPQTSQARQRLGLDPAAFMPEVTRVEEKRELTKNVWRDVWEIRTILTDDKFVLVTFKVEPNEDYANESMPEGYEIQTLHYNPGGRMRGRISATHAGIGTHGKPLREKRSIRVTGFGHSYDVPAGLVQSMNLVACDTGWKGLRGQGTRDAGVVWIFKDHWEDTTKEIRVEYDLTTISLAKARELVESRFLSLPELDKTGWSFTLPPSPAGL